jgi:hypothetical protein
MQCFTTDTHGLVIRERNALHDTPDGTNHIDLSPVVNRLMVSFEDPIMESC